MKFLAKYAVVGALLGAVTVYAQGTPPASPAPTPAKPGKSLSLGDMQGRLPTFEKNIRTDANHIRYLQDYSRKQRDVVKLSCVNDKLVQVKAQQNLFETAVGQFNGNKDNGADAARPAYADAEKAAADIKILRDEADACVGAPELYKQEADTTVEHPDFPDDPTTHDPFGIDVEPPAYASPFN